MKTSELKDLMIKSTDELDTDLKNKKTELFNLRFRLGTGRLQGASAIQRVKRDIARVKTIIRQRELKA